MCIIYSCHSGRPNDEMLRYAAKQEPDYAGVMWVKDGMVRYKKGLEIEGVLEWLGTNPPFPYLIHFRQASVGGKTKELSQPFPITPNASLALEGQAKSAIMHNGTVTAWRYELKQIVYAGKIKVPEGAWSDTRMLALAAHHFGPQAIPMIVDKDRVAILTSKGKVCYHGEWVDHDGYKASKVMFQVVENRAKSLDPYRAWSEDEDTDTFPANSAGNGKGTNAIVPIPDPPPQGLLEMLKEPNPKAFTRAELGGLLQKLHHLKAS